MSKDYYEILGVSPSAHAADIKRAYRKLAVMYHPDRNPDPHAEELFKKINEAYENVGDPAKRIAYDQRFVNQWIEVDSTPTPPAHRDPAYRRNRPRPSGPRISETQRLMQEYLPYMFWICWTSLVVSGLFFIDHVLPYQTSEYTISSVYAVKSRKNVTSHFVAVTTSGIEIKFYQETTIELYEGAKIRLAKTLIYGIRMWVELKGHAGRSRLAYIYHDLVFIPLTMFGVALFGILRKRSVDSRFNASIVCGIFLIIFLLLK